MSGLHDTGSDVLEKTTTYFDDESCTRCQLLPFFIEVCCPCICGVFFNLVAYGLWSSSRSSRSQVDALRCKMGTARRSIVHFDCEHGRTYVVPDYSQCDVNETQDLSPCCVSQQFCVIVFYARL